MNDWTGRVAVVTGGASGIGLAVARTLARRGMRLAIADVEVDALKAAQESLTSEGAEVLAVPTDVGDPEQMEALATRVRDECGPVSVAHLNAGVAGGGGPIESLSTEDWAWAFLP